MGADDPEEAQQGAGPRAEAYAQAGGQGSPGSGLSWCHHSHLPAGALSF